MVGVASKKNAVNRTRLEEINIRGLGVIDQALVEFSPGLNVITGETGAGKTMVLTALSLLLGEKADSDLIRNGHERMSVAGVFAIGDSSNSNLAELIDEHGIDFSENQIVVSRHVTKDGKSRALISGATSTAGTLATIGAELIEIHGQHGSLVLTKSTKQRELLDFSGRNNSSRTTQISRTTQNFHGVEKDNSRAQERFG